MKEFQITVSPFTMRVYQSACGCMVANVNYQGNDWSNNFDGLKLHILIAHNNQIAALDNAKEVAKTYHNWNLVGELNIQIDKLKKQKDTLTQCVEELQRAAKQYMELHVRPVEETKEFHVRFN